MGERQPKWGNLFIRGRLVGLVCRRLGPGLRPAGAQRRWEAACRRVTARHDSMDDQANGSLCLTADLAPAPLPGSVNGDAWAPDDKNCRRAPAGRGRIWQRAAAGRSFRCRIRHASSSDDRAAGGARAAAVVHGLVGHSRR